GSHTPPIDREQYSGSGRPTLPVIAVVWVGVGRVERHAARTATAINELLATEQRHGVGSPQALADGDTLRPLIDRCRHFGITTADLRRHGAQLPES
ncbi:hypothetical protein ACFV0W_31880, partial [Streptomyces anulatus]